ncbi:hypothetical protein GCM10010994_47150 [Chelatococcus reniformis]|uniref:Uncharacterized protein n=1 Tax=Chelatococcus reniformis TaxID=1494448 RepID=A0A916URY9_9HYPH|nr:hypothetical protein GCM10010994_47150 [Chelatococcus reniformis]
MTLFVMAGNTLLRPLVNAINRIPLDEEASEAIYEVSVVTAREAADRAKEELVAAGAEHLARHLELQHRRLMRASRQPVSVMLPSNGECSREFKIQKHSASSLCYEQGSCPKRWLTFLDHALGRYR